MVKKLRFTRHANEKLRVLIERGFRVDRRDIARAISKPARVLRKGKQFLALRRITDKYALKVCIGNVTVLIVVITFHPVRRKGYGL